METVSYMLNLVFFFPKKTIITNINIYIYNLIFHVTIQSIFIKLIYVNVCYWVSKIILVVFQIIAIDQLGKETGPSPAHSIVYRYLCFVATANKRFDKRDIKNLFIADIYMAKTSTMDVLQIYKKRVRINK